MTEEIYGIDRERAHDRARELVIEDFFWSGSDELGPFGSDEGFTALDEFRQWRAENTELGVVECLRWTVESVGGIDFAAYDSSLVDADRVKSQIEDRQFDDQQYIYTLDVSVISTAFGQLVDEGTIDADAKPAARVAISRQKLWASLQDGWAHAGEYIANLIVLERILEQA